MPEAVPDKTRDHSVKKGIQTTLISIAGFIAVIFGLFLYNFLEVRTLSDEQYQALGYYRFETSRPIPDFSLIDHLGQPVAHRNLEGQWSLLFFGFTFCPDICPTTMGVLNIAVREMNTRPQVIMVTVDPERDTPEQLAQYVPAFNPDFIGYTGPFDEIVKLATKLNIAFGKVPGATPGTYTVDHSSSIVVINPDGEYAGFIKAPHDPSRLKTIVDSFR